MFPTTLGPPALRHERQCRRPAPTRHRSCHRPHAQRALCPSNFVSTRKLVTLRTIARRAIRQKRFVIAARKIIANVYSLKKKYDEPTNRRRVSIDGNICCAILNVTFREKKSIARRTHNAILLAPVRPDVIDINGRMCFIHVA